MTMDVREHRGMMIAATANIIRKGNAWYVPSQSGSRSYAVRIVGGDSTCTCPDYEQHGSACKHIHAVGFAVRRGEWKDGYPTGPRPGRVSYPQLWPAYNTAQTTEKETFCHLLHDLVSPIPTPTQRTGRPRLPLSDMLFAAAFKVYSTMSGRRVATDLREAQAKGFIARAPHYNSVFEVIERADVTPILHDLIVASSLPLSEVEHDFAVDSTGFGTSQFSRYYTMKYRGERVGRGWVKAHAMVGVKTNVVTSVRIGVHNSHDSPQFEPLFRETAKNFAIREVSADKAYSGRLNVELAVSKGAAPYIPMKFNSRPDPRAPAWNRLFHLFAYRKDEFAAHYHKRSNVESTFSAIKRVFGDSVRSRLWEAQVNEVLLKILCHNVRCLIHAMHEL